MRTIENAGRKPTAIKLLALASTALVGLALPSAAQAQQWTGPTSDSWFDTTNWNPGHVPTSGDDVTINNASGYIPRISGTGNDAHANHILIGDTADNTLNLENGATLTSNEAILGNQAGASGAVAFGSPASASLTYWTNNGSLIVGNSGHGALTISRGTVSNTEAVIAANAGGSGFVGVNGATGIWANSGGLTVGNSGNGTLIVNGGGLVTSNRGFLGFNTGSNGTMTVDGAGSTWTNTDFLYVGANGTGALTISNGGKVQNTDASIGAGNGSGTVDVTGSGSTWANSGTLNVGHVSTGTLNITNGGKVDSDGGYIGKLAGSTGTVTVDGAGSAWTSSDRLNVGHFGDGTLVISNGGAVSAFNASVAYGGGNTGAVTVTGSGSIWSLIADAVIGDSGTGTLAIANGGTVNNDLGTVGFETGSTGMVTVDGAGSKWTNHGRLSIGESGSGALSVTSGGKVGSDGGYVGRLGGSTGTVTVDGTGSAWTSSDRLNVGHFGDGTLTISNGGAVSAFNASVAYGGGNTGAVTVTGSGSIWSLIADAAIGDSGTGTLTILNGGTVSNATGTVGVEAGSTGTVTVDGAGSKWTSNGSLYLGYDGSGTLHIANGGTVHAGFTALGSAAGSDGAMTVDGAGSAFVGSGNLTIASVDGATLAIAHGGMVDNLVGTIGANAGAIGTVTVDGAGSAWNSDGFLRVGDNGTGVLYVKNGGTVHDFAGVLASTGIVSAGHVFVDGAGSTWVNDAVTVIGLSGTARLDVTNGGLVTGGNGTIGSAANSQGLAIVQDAGSAWSLGGDLTVGDFGNGQLSITGGGRVSVGGALRLAENAGSRGDLNIGGNVAPGTLDAATVQFGAGSGRINFSHTGANYDFDAAITGLGTINQSGGVTRLTADSGGFSGATHVTGGTLLVDGKIGAGALDVQTGGTLGGKGVIGGAVTITAGGTLRGIQGQTLALHDLALAGGANVDVRLSTPGGAALFAIVSDLTLDGTLNLSSAGSFGPGVYSLMTYGGALTDNGLDIGTTPGGTLGSDFAIQTSVGGQVNLVSTAMPDLIFWDGDAAGSAGNNAVDGGSGIWSATSTNWTDLNGTANGAMQPQPGFAIFQGTAGTVTVDAGAGAVAVTGMQFASDGYRIAGAPILLADAGSVFRVGDGSAAGTNFRATIGSALRGSGGLEKTDLGTLILTAVNDYGGGTTITGGTLQLGNGGTSGSIIGDIVDNGTLAFNRSDETSLANAISGNGTILQNGAGTTNLTGNSGAFTGSVLVDAGRLGITGGGVLKVHVGYIGFDAGTTGAVTVDGTGSAWASTGQVVVGLSGNGSLTIANGGAVSANGALVLAENAGSTGVLNIGAAHGSAAAAAGTLDAAGLQFGNGSGTVNFNHIATNYQFATTMAGMGTINQIAGNTNLTGNSSGFVGAVNVRGGRLAVNGSLAGGQVTVGNGSTLGGNGLIGSLTAQSGAIVAPGNSIGMLNVAGNATFNAGSTYQVELTSTGQSDLINVAGAATIAKGALLGIVKTDAAPYVLGTHYTILTAAGGVSGSYTFNDIQITNFIGLKGGSNGTSIYLDVAKTKTFASAGLTANEIATGGALDTLPLANGLAGAVANLPTDAAAQAAFHQLSGEIHPSMASAMIEDSRFVREAALDRLRGAFGAMPPTSEGGIALWGRGFGSWGRIGSDGNAAAVKHDDEGYVMGLDGLVGSGWRVGFVGGYSHSNVRNSGLASSGTSDNYHVGVYAGTRQGKAAFRSGLAYTLHALSATRTVTFPGFSDALRSSYNARTTQAFGEFGYALQSGRVAFEPFANLAYVDHATDRFIERGGAAALSGSGGGTGVTFTTLGLRGAGLAFGSDVPVNARGTLGWRHAFGDTTPESTMAFPGSSSFGIGGVPIARDAAMVELGVDMRVGRNATLGFSYGGQFGARASEHAVRASFAVKF
jgi:fibronectin-binding autotransporter adhesin